MVQYTTNKLVKNGTEFNNELCYEDAGTPFEFLCSAGLDKFWDVTDAQAVQMRISTDPMPEAVRFEWSSDHAMCELKCLEPQHSRKDRFCSPNWINDLLVNSIYAEGDILYIRLWQWDKE